MTHEKLLMVGVIYGNIMYMKTFATKIMDQEQKNSLTSRIKDLLLSEKSTLFAYLYGSFLGAGPFRDIDVAAYADPAAFKNTDKMFSYGLSLAAKVDLAVSGVTVDLRLLNLAPTPFKFGVITKGKVIFTRDDQKRMDFEVRTRSLYFDFLPHLKLHHRSLVLGE
jgi:hypothetical protein